MANKENDFVTVHGKNGKSWVMHESQFDKEEQDKKKQIRFNTSERIKKQNEELEKTLDKNAGEYRNDYNEHGFDIVHFHFKDRQIYQVWKDGIYLDEGESTQELLEIIREQEEK